MLTDEELAELEAAVVMFDGSISSIAALGIATMVEFTRDAIARERAMRLPLTAEICERLGMVRVCKRNTFWKEYAYEYDTGCLSASFYIGGDLDRIDDRYLMSRIRGVVLETNNPTVGHLFAAAKLAGVTLDWRKVGE